MAYNATYTAEDMSAVVIDFIVTFGAVLVGFAALIAILWLLKKFGVKLPFLS